MSESSQLESIRHSLAHLLAAAVLELHPNAKQAIGPAIENGFYYDFDFDFANQQGLTQKNTRADAEKQTISDEDLSKIEKKMREILETWKTFERREISADEARKLFADNPYKLELIDEYRDAGLTVYTSGSYTDLCRGGHVGNVKEIDPEAFKLSHTAGAYWRGSEKNKQLTRIYGLGFGSKKELNDYIAMQEEAKKRDHRKLGKELELFTIIDEVGPGLPLFYPKGAILRRLVEEYITELQEARGYVPIWIPHITKGRLYEISGHLAKYDAMYPPMHLKDEADYYLKPMNCPHFMMLYKSMPHSYRELPLRYTSTTTNYRYEKSGELSGLTRVRALTQDDCHVFARPDQIEEEVNLMLDMVSDVYAAFGFHDFRVRISTGDQANPGKYIGDPEIWKRSEAILKNLVKNRGWDMELGAGEAAFYGPKIDFIFKDVLGREWQLSTVQLDMNLPARFELEYADSDGTAKTPVVIHRAILGSTERFLGILIEHCGGAFPVWLAPIQAIVLPISEKQNRYAQNVYAALRRHGIRTEIDSENETVGKKIRGAEMQKIPYILIVGDKESRAGKVAVRKRSEGDLGQMNLDKFIEHMLEESKPPLRL